jgi:hypothetical protein
MDRFRRLILVFTLTHLLMFQEELPMKKAYFQIAYIVLSAAALIVAAGAPIPWTGSGGGSFMNSLTQLASSL